MKSLVIAEKPSVAKDIAKVLKVPAKGDIFENDEYVISSAVGHLVSLCDPDDYDAKLKRWSRKTLPILPSSFKIKASTERGAKDQFLKLKKLMERADVTCVVNACDAGREGELIFAYIYDLAGCKKETKRLWLTSMTPTAVREGFENLLGGEEKFNLCEAARCRAESDWLIGMNGTRAVTLRTSPAGKGQVATVGRVQTPTLSLIVQRELDIRNFDPKTYWRIVGEFGVAAGTYEGVYQRPDFKKTDKNDGNAEAGDKADRVWDKAQAEAIFEACKNATTGTISEEKKHTTEACQRLYDLTTLQREANKRFGFPATKTLQIAQALYEKHKATTYPRTDSRALPEDYIGTCYRTLEALEVRGAIGKFAARVCENKWVRPNKRIFNNKEISDHFAIIPTDQPPKAALSADEEKIYDMVVRRFVAVFFPPAEFDVTTRMTCVAGHNFKTEGKVLVVPGWKEVYGREEGKAEDSLPAVTAEDGDPASAKVLEIQCQEESTKPPTRYTEATLLAAMESAGKFVEDEELALAMKERGLGTPATRAGIIDHLIKTKYVDRAGRDLVPTIKAEQLMVFLKVTDVEILTSPAMTGDWEFRLQEVAEGKRSRKEFMEGIVTLTTQIVEKVGADGGDEQWSETELVSPTDGKVLLENYRLYRSQDSVVVGNGRSFPALVIYKNASGHNLTIDEVRKLLADGEIGPIDDFKSRFGKPFTATLKLEKNESGLLRAAFVFPEREGDAAAAAFDYATGTVIGECPVSKLKIYDTPNGYRTNPEEAKSLKTAPFSMAKKMLGAEITVEQVQKLLTEGKTDLIKGFISNRTKRSFDAFLCLGKNSTKVRFEFPPREAKPKSETKKAPAKRKLIKKPASGAGIKANDDADIQVG
ncbi:MAG: DNA topoisomerase 3 [Opitutales bacterium]|nr:DNA topoisomerase 3 [Opitutales bacterium]